MRRFFSKKTSALLAIPLLCAVLLVSGWNSAQAVSSVTAQLSPNFTIIIDGTPRDFYNTAGQEVHPILCDGTTYLPVRAIGELMGKNVDWNQTTKTVTLSGSRSTPAATGTPDARAAVQNVPAELRDDFTVVVDGSVRTFTDANGKVVYPLLYNGSTYLPVRAIGELMGKAVSWDSSTKTVTLTGSLVTDADTFSGSGGIPAGTGTPAGLISLEDAKAKALTHAGVKADAAVFVEQKLDRDDGKQVYEVEFYTADGKEYDYKIDAGTGEVLSFDYDAEHMPALTGSDGKPLPTVITREKAREIALAKVPGAGETHVTKLKSDLEDGRPVYEVEIVYNGMEYDFEIDAATGTIIPEQVGADFNVRWTPSGPTEPRPARNRPSPGSRRGAVLCCPLPHKLKIVLRIIGNGQLPHPAQAVQLQQDQEGVIPLSVPQQQAPPAPVPLAGERSGIAPAQSRLRQILPDHPQQGQGVFHPLLPVLQEGAGAVAAEHWKQPLRAAPPEESRQHGEVVGLIEHQPSGILSHGAVPGQHAVGGHRRPCLHAVPLIFRHHLHGVAQLDIAHPGGDGDAEELCQGFHAQKRLPHLGILNGALEQDGVLRGLHHAGGIPLRVVADPQREAGHPQAQGIALPDVRQDLRTDQIHHGPVLPVPRPDKDTAAHGVRLCRGQVLHHGAVPDAGGGGVGIHTQQLLLAGGGVAHGPEDHLRVPQPQPAVIPPVSGSRRVRMTAAASPMRKR